MRLDAAETLMYLPIEPPRIQIFPAPDYVDVYYVYLDLNHCSFSDNFGSGVFSAQQYSSFQVVTFIHGPGLYAPTASLG